MTPLEALFVGVLLTLLWMLIGAGMVTLLRPDLSEDTFAALANMTMWPAGVLMQGFVWPIYKRHRERARQRRITAKVRSGEYSLTHARTLNVQTFTEETLNGTVACCCLARPEQCWRCRHGHHSRCTAKGYVKTEESPG